MKLRIKNLSEQKQKIKLFGNMATANVDLYKNFKIEILDEDFTLNDLYNAYKIEPILLRVSSNEKIKILVEEVNNNSNFVRIVNVVEIDNQNYVNFLCAVNIITYQLILTINSLVELNIDIINISNIEFKNYVFNYGQI